MAVVEKPLKLGPVSGEPSVVWQLEQAGAPLIDCINSAAPFVAFPGGKFCQLVSVELQAARNATSKKANKRPNRNFRMKIPCVVCAVVNNDIREI